MLTKNEQILALLIFTITVYFTWKINNLDNKNIEKFVVTNTSETQDAIKLAIKKIYLADVQAIRLLSDVAIQLNQNNTTISDNIKFMGTITANNITTTGNLTATGNIDVSGNLTATNINTTGTVNTPSITFGTGTPANVTTTNFTTTGNVNVNTAISLTGNSLKLNNKTDSINKYTINVPDDTSNIMQIARLNNGISDISNGFKLNGNTGTFECKEIKCNKITSNINTSGSGTGGAAPGAFLINETFGAFPIYHSMYYYTDYSAMGNSDNAYIVMPGYKLTMYYYANWGNTPKVMDNTPGTTPKFYKLPNNNEGGSCKLEYKYSDGTLRVIAEAPKNIG